MIANIYNVLLPCTGNSARPRNGLLKDVDGLEQSSMPQDRSA